VEVAIVSGVLGALAVGVLRWSAVRRGTLDRPVPTYTPRSWIAGAIFAMGVLGGIVWFADRLFLAIALYMAVAFVGIGVRRALERRLVIGDVGLFRTTVALSFLGVWLIVMMTIEVLSH
jgi:hypothetical protein